jgi:hypothetical protein
MSLRCILKQLSRVRSNRTTDNSGLHVEEWDDEKHQDTGNVVRVIPYIAVSLRWLHISAKYWKAELDYQPKPSKSSAVQRWEGVTEEELKEFDEASSHPYECNCDLCKKWHELMGPEPEE